MNRELWEESGKTNLCKTHKEVGDTKILGFFRWVIKGGKPEFVGLTKLHCDLLSLYANKKEVFGRKEFLITRIDDIEEIVEELITAENISEPLFMNLLCLKRYYQNEKEDLEKFIFRH